MFQKIIIKRGLKVNLPTLDVGEFGLCTDTKELFIGTNTGNELIANNTSLSDLTDIDLSNMTNGNVLTYDSETSKIKLSPLPSGQGSGATNLDGLTDVDVTTIAPSEGDFLKYNGGVWKPSSDSNLSSTIFYTIELTRWGIKNDNTDPINTTIGINDALLWANQQGYTYVKLPHGNYLIAKGIVNADKSNSASIVLQSNMTLDLRGCTLTKETNSWTTYYAITGKDLVNTSVIGGTLVGDRLTHDYSNLSEIYEWCIGINIEGGVDYFTLDGMEIKDFPGYSVGVSGDSYQFRQLTSSDIEAGNIDNSGVTQASSAFVRTVNYINLSIAEPRLSQLGYFMITGNGYNSYGFKIDGGSIDLTNTIFSLHFYDSSNIFLGTVKSKVYDPINKSTFPLGAVKFKVSFRYEYAKIIQGTFYLSLDTKRLSSGVTIRNCNIHHSYALGVALSTTVQTTIENNEFHDIGFAMRDIGRNLYYFPMAIDIEDGGNANQQMVIRNNIFRDNQSLHVNIVQARNVLVEGNKFQGTGGITFQGMKGSNFISRHNQYNLTYGTGESSTFVEFINDHFIGANLSLDYSSVYSGCVFDEMTFGVQVTTHGIYSNSTKYSLGNTILPTVKNGYYYVCTTSMNIVSTEPTWGTTVGGTTTDSGGNVWTAYIYDPTYEPLVFRNCKFNYNQPETFGGWLLRRYNLTFEGCIFNINSGRYFTDASDINDFAGKNAITFKDCKVNMTTFGSISANKANIIRTSFASPRDGVYLTNSMIANQLSIEDCTFDSSPFIFYPRVTSGSSFTFRDNTYTVVKAARTYGDNVEGMYIKNFESTVIDRNRINLPVTNLDIRPFGIWVEDYFRFTNNFIKSTRSSNNIEIWGAKRTGGDLTPIPSTVSFIDDNYFSNLIVNQDISYIKQLRKMLGNGFIDLQSNTLGSSNSVSVEPTSGFFYLGQILYNSSPVVGGYLAWVCLTSGIAASITWSSTTTYSVGQIIHANGKVYRCTVAGTSSSVAPSHTTGTSTDGTVTWEYLNNKAVFKPYGLIQE